MRKKVLIGIAAVVALVAIFVLPKAYRSFCQFQKDTIPIIAYHKIVDNDPSPYVISTKDFDEHLQYLTSNGYKAISLMEMRDLLEEKRLGKPTKLGTEKYIVLTFDDGYANNLEFATPILHKYGYKATVFMITGFVNNDDFLTAGQLKTMRIMGWEIGSHGDTHLPLGDQKRSKVEWEAFISKQYIEYSTRQMVNFVAYPYGSFTKETAEIFGEFGYWGGLTGIDGVNSPDTDPWAYKRVNMPQDKFYINTLPIRLFRAQVRDWLKNLNT